MPPPAYSLSGIGNWATPVSSICCGICCGICCCIGCCICCGICCGISWGIGCCTGGFSDWAFWAIICSITDVCGTLPCIAFVLAVASIISALRARIGATISVAICFRWAICIIMACGNLAKSSIELDCWRMADNILIIYPWTVIMKDRPNRC